MGSRDPDDRSADGVRVLRAAERFVTRAPGLDTRHCFSFGGHYRPDNVSFGGLIAFNDDCVAPGAGYPAHSHARLDLLSWVVAGRLRHEQGYQRQDLDPGSAQLLAAGTGVQHSEVNSGTSCLRFVQMWFRDDESEPAVGDSGVRYECAQIGLEASGWIPVAGGSSSAAPLRLGGEAASVFVARVETGEVPPLPVQGWVHLFVVAGRATAAGFGELRTGDSLRAVGAAGLRLGEAAGAELLLVSAPPTR